MNINNIMTCASVSLTLLVFATGASATLPAVGFEQSSDMLPAPAETIQQEQPEVVLPTPGSPLPDSV